MKISPVTNVKLNQNFKSYKKQNVFNNTIQNYNPVSYNSSYYLTNFTGGYTLDLGKTYERLNSDEFPPDIEENIKEILSKGNNGSKTLYDVHFNKYKGVLDCYTLDELKQRYPEFNDVKSAYEVETAKNSFVDEFLNGNSEAFSTEEDLTLQLIKLYWGQGFSLSDLSDYISKNTSDGKGINLHYTMSKKLNIPLMNSKYAQVLKLSNKEYNAKFKEEMSIKLKEAKEAKIQRAEGEPVIIPSGALSDAHKQHISDALIEYYRQNPEKVYLMSLRQKKFLEENPDLKEKISIAMDYAWNRTQEGRSIKKYLSKFMKKSALSDKELALNSEMTSVQKQAFKDFWQKNPWAGEKFAVASKEGWDFVRVSEKFDGKSISGKKISFHAMPSQVMKQIENWVKQRHISTDNIKFGIGVAFMDDKEAEDKKAISLMEKKNKIVDMFTREHPDLPDKVATCQQFAIISFKKDLENASQNLPKSLLEHPDKRRLLNVVLDNYLLEHPVYDEIGEYSKFPIENISVPELDLIMVFIMKAAIICDSLDVADYFNKKLDEVYNILEEGNFEKLYSIME